MSPSTPGSQHSCVWTLYWSAHDPVCIPLDVSHVFPEFPVPDLGSVLLQDSVTPHDVKALQLVYRRHCEVTAPPGKPWEEPTPGLWGFSGYLGAEPGMLPQAHRQNCQTLSILGVPDLVKETGVALFPLSEQ